MAKSEFDLFLQEEVQKQKGVAYPIKAGLIERLTTKNCHVISFIPIRRMSLRFQMSDQTMKSFLTMKSRSLTMPARTRTSLMNRSLWKSFIPMDI